ncbi:hypothetical protein ACHAWF_004257 [Thalassiosira exigua]
MELVMRNNIFELGDMYFLQLIDTGSNHHQKLPKGHEYLSIHPTLNSMKQDHHNMAVKLFTRFATRDWDKTTIKSNIILADNELRHRPTTTPTPEPFDIIQQLFIHWEYHPNYIPQMWLRELYELDCGPIL